MPYLKYNGPLVEAQVTNYGHFKQGEEKRVDSVTAGAFEHPACKAEGWTVRPDEASVAAKTRRHETAVEIEKKEREN